ncbi:HesA/MoeB/ThiF family protein [Nonomuraea lactucae]|uniref:HesA/MoeB/ThiF family protein n=1 Tax=Nonomuraea lactucae TaxID=2249762 RepID=UPI000DE43AE5|nr:ThiF family adenylyltransferase [Nonomuraea lactucae]
MAGGPWDTIHTLRNPQRREVTAVLKPKIKDAHRPIPRPNGTIWIGSIQYGLGTELDDGTGLVWPICRRMDGTLSRDQLITAVAAEHSAKTTDIEEIVDFLIQSGWVEDLGAAQPPTMTARELERYERSVQFQSWIDATPRSSRYELQNRLKTSKVTILGVGGIGSAVASSLVASGVGHVHCVDCDEVELTNLNRQLLYTEADVGRRKVEVAVERLRDLNRDIQVTGTDTTLSSPDDIVASIRGSDVFLLCADIPHEIVHWANEAMLRVGIPLVIGSYTGPMLCVGTHIPRVTGCHECMLAGERERLGTRGEADLLDAEHDIPGFNPVMAPTAQMTGHFAAMETLFLLFGMPVQTAGRRIHRNFLDYDHQYYIEAERRPGCPACGDDPDLAG